MMISKQEFAQLPLALRSDNEASFDFFVASLAFIDYLKSVASGASSDWVWLQGNPGWGKTHLLSAMSQAAGRPAGYLDAPALLESGPQCLQALGGLELVLVDNFDQLLEPAWEEAWFHQINRWRRQGVQLVVAASSRLRSQQLGLADLNSRLRMMVELQIEPLSPEGRGELLQRRATARGFALDSAVMNYLLARQSRSAAELVALLDTLGKESLSAQRKLTVPFVRQVLARQ